MLQQTQAGRVVPHYTRFVEAFPSPAACAAAGAGTTVRMWSGLGYNRRALNLHRAATTMVDLYGGDVPRQDQALRALAGVGAYTARAVRAFAFAEDVAAVDTNAVRVLARSLSGGPITVRRATELGDASVPEGAGWDFNQAMFDLGATVCTPRDPACPRCPLRRLCTWRRAGADPGRPDPWRLGPTTRRQGTFAGSDRQGRGRLLDALLHGGVRRVDLARTCGWPAEAERAGRVAAALVSEGFAEWSGARGAVLRLR